MQFIYIFIIVYFRCSLIMTPMVKNGSKCIALCLLVIICILAIKGIPVDTVIYIAKMESNDLIKKLLLVRW